MDNENKLVLPAPLLLLLLRPPLLLLLPITVAKYGPPRSPSQQ